VNPVDGAALATAKISRTLYNDVVRGTWHCGRVDRPFTAPFVF
jgi:hypothetical protein